MSEVAPGGIWESGDSWIPAEGCRYWLRESATRHGGVFVIEYELLFGDPGLGLEMGGPSSKSRLREVAMEHYAINGTSAAALPYGIYSGPRVEGSWEEPCFMCQGSGEDFSDAGCQECDGTGYVHTTEPRGSESNAET